MSERRETSRAEQVRLRRAQEQTKRLDRAVKETTRPLSVTATRAKASTPKRKTKPPQTPRRRFQVAMPNVPLSRPNFRALRLPRPRLGWRTFSLGLVAVIGVLVYLAFNIPQLQAAGAQVNGNRIISAAEVNTVLSVTGRPIFLVDPAELETRLRLNYPELVSVQVAVDLPNLVTVNLLERKPVIRWEQSGGYTWIAEDGVAFRPRGELDGLIAVVAESTPPASTVVPDPLNPAPFISTDMVQAIQGLAASVPPGMKILYDARMGFGWDDPRGWRVYFGATALDVPLKMRVYESMVNSLMQRGIRPALINVTYPTAPYYRMTK